MGNYFATLTDEEKKLLFDAPVYVSLLAALEDGKISKKELEDATTLVHYRTFTSKPILHKYFKAAETQFRDRLNREELELSEDIEASRTLLHNKLHKVNSVLSKMDEKFVTELKLSLHTFANHIVNVNTSWIQSLPIFVDPFLRTKKKDSSEELF